MDWQISAMDCKVSENNLSDVVYNVHWRCSATEDGYSASVYSTCSLPAPDPANFTDYNSLTLDQVLGWIWANGVNKEATEAAVLAQIEAQKNPVSATGVPW
jgi:hypothetical protein